MKGGICGYIPSPKFVFVLLLLFFTQALDLGMQLDKMVWVESD